MFRLERTQFENARELFKALHYQLAVESMLDGTNPGYVYVDDIQKPTCAWMSNSEGFFLTGDSSNSVFKGWLKEWFQEFIYEHSQKDDLTACIYFDIDDDSWISTFPEIFSSRPPLRDNRIHYICTEVKIDWRERLPEGYRVHRIDDKLFRNKNISYPHHLYPHWINSNWGSLERYLELGFGTCVVHRNRIVSYSLCDCISGDECEIGIQTLPEFRRSGLATIAAAANAEHAFSLGYQSVGWHTHDYNLGSQRTAERVGFEKERGYVQYACMVFEAMQIAETGVRQFMQGQHESAITTFENSFVMSDVDPWFYYMCARSNAILGRDDRAFELLSQAVEKGWSNAVETRDCEDLSKLQTDPRWEDIIIRMETYSKD